MLSVNMIDTEKSEGLQQLRSGNTPMVQSHNLQVRLVVVPINNKFQIHKYGEGWNTNAGVNNGPC